MSTSTSQKEHGNHDTTHVANGHHPAPKTSAPRRQLSNGTASERSLKVPSQYSHPLQHQSPSLRNRSRSRSPLSNGHVSNDRHASPSPASALPNLQQRGSASQGGRTNSWDRYRSLIYVALSQFFNVLMNVAARTMEVGGNGGKGFHPMHILFARMGVTFVLASAYMWYAKTPDFPLGKREVRGWLVLRGFGGFFGVFGMYYSLMYLPLADATVITFLAPSLSCWVCSYVLKEPFTRLEQVGAYISLLGVALIARPTFLFSAASTPESSPPASGTPDSPVSGVPSYEDVTPAQRLTAVLVALVGVLGATTAYTTIRCIGRRAHPLISVNYYAAWTTFVTLASQILIPSIGFVLPRNTTDLLMLSFMGMCGFTMQFMLAAGLQGSKGSAATMMVYTQMLWATGADWLVFGQGLSVWSAVGSTLILGSAGLVAIKKGRDSGTREKQERGETTSEVERQDEERGLVEGIDEEDDLDQDGRGDVPLRTFR